MHCGHTHTHARTAIQCHVHVRIQLYVYKPASSDKMFVLQATLHALLASWLEQQQHMYQVPILASPTAHPTPVLLLGKAAVSFGALAVVLAVGSVLDCFKLLGQSASRVCVGVCMGELRVGGGGLWGSLAVLGFLLNSLGLAWGSAWQFRALRVAWGLALG